MPEPRQAPEDDIEEPTDTPAPPTVAPTPSAESSGSPDPSPAVEPPKVYDMATLRVQSADRLTGFRETLRRLVASGTFPSRAQMSWRVRMIENTDLDPEEFWCDKRNPGQTRYLLITGPNTFFPTPASIPGGALAPFLENTVVVVEVAASHMIAWNSNQDLSVEQAVSQKPFEDYGTGAFLGVLGNGQIVEISTGIPNDLAIQLMTVGNGKPIELNKYVRALGSVNWGILAAARNTPEPDESESPAEGGDEPEAGIDPDATSSSRPATGGAAPAPASAASNRRPPPGAAEKSKAI
ncbi:MAG: hypothetical protein KDA41_22620 [Planctomycetales bacterium]|nr:hypothetical protein [Planctomycetales bacterium]